MDFNFFINRQESWTILNCISVFFTALGGMKYMHFLKQGLTVSLVSLVLLKEKGVKRLTILPLVSFESVFDYETILFFVTFLIILAVIVFVFSIGSSDLDEIIKGLFVVEFLMIFAVVLSKIGLKTDSFDFLVIIALQIAITIVFLLEYRGKTEETKEIVMIIIFNNAIAGFLADYTVIQVLLQTTIFLSVIKLVAKFDVNKSYGHRMLFSIFYQSFIAIILSSLGFYRSFSINCLLLLLVVLTTSFFKESDYEFKEKNLSVEKGIFNKIATGIMFINFHIRIIFNFLSKDYITAIIFGNMIVIFGFLLNTFGWPGLGYGIPFSLLVLDFNSRMAVKSWQGNDLYDKRAKNNLNYIQYRSMKHAARIVVDYATAHPQQAIAGAITAVGGSIVLAQSVVSHMDSVASTEATEEATKATEEATKATENNSKEISKQNDIMKQNQSDDNKKWAIDKLAENPRSDTFKEQLAKVAETGDMKNITEKAIEEEYKSKESRDEPRKKWFWNE